MPLGTTSTRSSPGAPPACCFHALRIADDGEDFADFAGTVAVLLERRDESRLAGARGELFGGVVGHELPLRDDQNAPAGHLHFREVVGGENDGALTTNLPNELTDLGGLVRVEAAHRLVEDQHRRLVNQCLRKAHALTKALRKLANALADDVAEAGFLDHPAEPRVETCTAKPAHLADELQVLEHQHLGVERGGLGQITDELADRDRVLEDVGAADLSRTSGRRDEAGQDLHRRGLPGAIGSEETDDLAAIHLKSCVL